MTERHSHSRLYEGDRQCLAFKKANLFRPLILDARFAPRRCGWLKSCAMLQRSRISLAITMSAKRAMRLRYCRRWMTKGRPPQLAALPFRTGRPFVCLGATLAPVAIAAGFRACPVQAGYGLLIAEHVCRVLLSDASRELDRGTGLVLARTFACIARPFFEWRKVPCTYRKPVRNSLARSRLQSQARTLRPGVEQPS